MSSAFTEYIRLLEPGEPSPECFAAFWDFLRDALISEMRKRGLWKASPGYLGIYGRSGWSEGDALEELLVDCYAFLLSRLRGLKAQLEHKSDIQGLLFLNVRHFLYERQKKHDPLGFRIFTLLQAAMREGIAERALHVVSGHPKVRNDTILAFASRGDPETVVESAGLGEHVRRWSDDLLPDLVLAHGRGLVRVRSQLKARVLGLRRHGIEAFRYADVIEPLKSDVRARWRAVWQHSEGELAIEDDEGDLVTLVQRVRPEAELEERNSFQLLLSSVDEAIETLDEPQKARLHLHQLWLCLRSHAAETEPASSRAGKAPSQRALAKLLGISRNRLPELLATLGRLVEACRADISGKAAVRKKQEDPSATRQGSQAP